MRQDVASIDGLESRRQDLRRLRRVATGVLTLLALVFLATFAGPDPSGWVMFVRSVAEADMIGGLADWFAVEAIFRHPLRLPIPHTALLRRRKDAAAENIGRFIETYAVIPEDIAEQLRRAQPVAAMSRWIKAHSDYAAEIVHDVLLALPAATRTGPLRGEIESLVALLVEKGAGSPAISRLVADMLGRSVRGQGFDQILSQLSELVDARRDAILDIVQENSRWWIAAPVDRRLANLIVDAVLAVIEDLRDRDSELRAGFETVFADFVAEMERRGSLNDLLFATAQRSSLPGLSAALVDAGAEVLSDVLKDSSRLLRRMIATTLEQTAEELLADPERAAELDRRLASLVTSLTRDNRRAIGRYLADTLKSWDTDLLIDRIESEVGPDLQFVRINGAVLGGSIGGVIFGIEALLG